MSLDFPLQRFSIKTLYPFSRFILCLAYIVTAPLMQSRVWWFLCCQHQSLYMSSPSVPAVLSIITTCKTLSWFKFKSAIISCTETCTGKWTCSIYDLITVQKSFYICSVNSHFISPNQLVLIFSSLLKMQTGNTSLFSAADLLLKLFWENRCNQSLQPPATQSPSPSEVFSWSWWAQTGAKLNLSAYEHVEFSLYAALILYLPHLLPWCYLLFVILFD